MKRTIYDITHSISKDIAPWPGDIEFQQDWSLRMDTADPANVSRITLSSHFGTHMDAPAHFARDGITIDEIDPEVTIGPCVVLDLRSYLEEDDLVEPDTLELASGQLYTISPSLPSRVLVCTGYVPGRPFRTDFVSFAPQAMHWLWEQGVSLVGTDAPSVDPIDSTDYPAHRASLERGMVLLEGLNLDSIQVGVYHLIALPLKIAGGEGSPVRAVLVNAGGEDSQM